MRKLIIIGIILLLIGCVSINNDTKKESFQPDATKEITLCNEEKEEVFNKIDTATNEVDKYDVIMMVRFMII